MSNQSKSFLENLVPFIVVGVGIALVISLLFMFFYIAVWGIVIGGILWLAALTKQYLFPNKPAKKDGRIIEHDDDDNK